MNIGRFILLLVVLTPTFTYGQEARAFFVNSFAFDFKDGIEELHSAWDRLESTDFFPDPGGQESFDAKRRSLIDPVLAKIEAFSRKFENANNVRIVDLGRLDSQGAILYYDPSVDSTRIFTKAYNENTFTSPETQSLKPPRIAFFNTLKLFLTRAERDCAVRGMPKGTPVPANDSGLPTCHDSGVVLKAFFDLNGFDLVIDRAFVNTDEIIDSQVEDVTDKFIKYSKGLRKAKEN